VDVLSGALILILILQTFFRKVIFLREGAASSQRLGQKESSLSWPKPSRAIHEPESLCTNTNGTFI
jgi:hypothetical protein